MKHQLGGGGVFEGSVGEHRMGTGWGQVLRGESDPGPASLAGVTDAVELRGFQLACSWHPGP